MSETSAWADVGATEEIPLGEGRELVVGDRLVAVYRTEDDRFYALDGVCPHQGGPLGKGQLNGCIVTCPWHGWQFDVQNGQHQINASLQHAGFPVKIENGRILVQAEAS